MFEKEAEEAFNEWKSEQYKDQSTEEKMEFVEHLHYFQKHFEKTFKAGYNKANEWQEGLPTKDIRLAIIEVEDCGYLLCEYRKGVWYDNGSSAVCKDWITRNIKRWKEIVLPKESK